MEHPGSVIRRGMLADFLGNASIVCVYTEAWPESERKTRRGRCPEGPDGERAMSREAPGESVGARGGKRRQSGLQVEFQSGSGGTD